MTHIAETSFNGLPTRLLHTMLRVSDLERSVDFYTRLLGMTLMRKERYPQGQFTLAFLGYGEESTAAVIELTHNWGDRTYAIGDAFGHIAVGCSNVHATCRLLERAGATVIRQPGPLSEMSPDRTDIEHIAFIQDPDGYRIELVQQ
ncbi:lactoylglutathione lyase [Acidovorax sp.]|uniref:lactoylglutathione lyase n=1 Tax=Acidovorax sp. TaxID=1872122 RepID=UPI002ACEAEE2|nr:lactoylglutathione lyase [Acidovorax sp.]MDZ7863266.1 lactoylglutathione lyase [Acidovorax sp.]